MSPARAPRPVRLRRLQAWWARRSLRARITVVVGGVAVLALLALARVATGLISYAVTDAADTQLRVVAQSAAAEVAAGRAVAPGAGQPRVRVLDTAGQPVDGGPAVPLRPNDLRRLSGGDAITEFGADEARRLLAVPAATPDGVPRLVLASSELVGYYTVLRHGRLGLALFALLAAAAVTLAAWITAGLALRPVDRMRASAAALPPGERLPVPPAHDELGALAGELNALLARRDDAVSRLERFTGDAAHELRSPVASIRAQADVAVVHPDPALAQETLRSVAQRPPGSPSCSRTCWRWRGRTPAGGHRPNRSTSSRPRGTPWPDAPRPTAPSLRARCCGSSHRCRPRSRPHPARWPWYWTTCSTTPPGTRRPWSRCRCYPQGVTSGWWSTTTAPVFPRATASGCSTASPGSSRQPRAAPGWVWPWWPRWCGAAVVQPRSVPRPRAGYASRSAGRPPTNPVSIRPSPFV